MDKPLVVGIVVAGSIMSIVAGTVIVVGGVRRLIAARAAKKAQG